MQRFTRDVPEKGENPNARCHYMVANSTADLGAVAPSIAPENEERMAAPKDWYGNLSFNQACQKAIAGDMSLVEASDKLLSRYEAHAFETYKLGWRNDVYGILPDVPAFIAGHPLSMRRRVRQESPAAPIAIVVDTTISAHCQQDAIMRRGAAILALVRILTTRRPVELWAASMVDGDNGKSCVTVMARIDTAPLSLGTAAFALTHPAFPRRLCYAMARANGFSGRWPFAGGVLSQKHMAEIIKPAVPHVAETLMIPGMHIIDQASTEPEKWLDDRLAELMPANLRAA